jgi:hypothetical protein
MVVFRIIYKNSKLLKKVAQAAFFNKRLLELKLLNV